MFPNRTIISLLNSPIFIVTALQAYRDTKPAKITNLCLNCSIKSNSNVQKGFQNHFGLQMTLSTPRLGFIGRSGAYLLAGLAILGVFLCLLQLLKIPRESSSHVEKEMSEDVPDEANEKNQPSQLHHQLKDEQRKDVLAASKLPATDLFFNDTSIRRSCNPPKFLSYDELEALRYATGGAALGRLIHHSWKTPSLPPRFGLYSKTWCECFNAWPQVLWTDADNGRLVRDKFAWFQDVFREFAKPINSLDTLRYMYLMEYGGLYTDLDNLCLQPFEHLLHGYGIVFGDMETAQYKNRPFHFVQNSYDFDHTDQCSITP